MSTVETAERMGALRALLDEALRTADDLNLEMVAAYLSMAQDALLMGEVDG